MGIEKTRSNYVNGAYRYPIKVTGWAQCDTTGAIVDHKDLVKQMEYDGQGLYYTGFMVYKEFADEPQEQLLKPKIKNDPMPIRNARPIFVLTTTS